MTGMLSSVSFAQSLTTTEARQAVMRVVCGLVQVALKDKVYPIYFSAYVHSVLPYIIHSPSAFPSGE
jgi:hypothetical protein